MERHKAAEEGLDQMVEEVVGLEKESGLYPVAMGTIDSFTQKNGPRGDPGVPGNSCGARTMLYSGR